MAVTLNDLLAELPEVTRNSTTGALDNTKRTRAINRVLQDMQDFADWDFTKRTQEFDFIDDINEYSLENYIGTTCQDNDGSTTILDFKNPHDIRVVDESYRPFEYRPAKEVRYHIARNRHFNEYGVDGDLLIINYPRQTSAQLHNCDDLTANGTWSASSDATNLTIDTIEFKESSGALNFDVSAGTSLVLTNSDFNAKDLEELQNKSYLVVWVFLPTITDFSSIKAEWGDDASNNWSKTETAPAAGATLATGWNRFAFEWAEATENGSPDETAVNFVRFTITYSSSTTDTDFRIDDVRIARAVPMKLDYYSLAMVKDTAGDFQLEFNPSDVTMTDELVHSGIKRTVIEAAAFENFEMIGGKSERDRTDTAEERRRLYRQIFGRFGNRIRRPAQVLSFPGRRGRY